jgi:hypothetical protein
MAKNIEVTIVGGSSPRVPDAPKVEIPKADPKPLEEPVSDDATVALESPSKRSKRSKS